MAPSDQAAETGNARDRDHLAGRLELGATVLMAVATILTAWSAFQSTKWSGVQANSYASAAAARTQSTKASTAGGQAVIVDVQLFTQWLDALVDERRIDPNASEAPDGSYEPDPDELSGFFFERFRDEFKPAVRAWLALRPLQTPDAHATPFTMTEYRVAETDRSDELERRADALAAEARRANQRGDNYVLTTVLFAAVLFFAGISTKLESLRNRALLSGFAVLMLLTGVAILATYPVEV